MWIFGLKGLTKFCVFDLYTVIKYDLITIVRYSKPEAGTTERERERERKALVGSGHVAPEQN